MKKCGLLVICALFFFCMRADAGWFGNSLRTGTYELRGSNNETGSWQYQGTVIVKQQGNNFALTWIIGGKQLQVGIGILDNEVLSVAYYDATNPNGTGVVSYRLTSDDTLEGKWTGLNGMGYGREALHWVSY